MNTTSEQLRYIKTFPQLLNYLRDELDWPIEKMDIEDLVFDYTPDEMGLNPADAVKVKQIKQLRPLTSEQPWGIFFVQFEPKKLPVLVLRRILSHLVVKKRASANKGDRPTWQLHDLLFISAYGEEEHRDISFAHFADDPGASLPVLRVLGWDDEDTGLHLDHVQATLEDKLHWPQDTAKADTWRKNWSSAFTLKLGYVARTSKELSIQMADLARRIRKRANRVLVIESDKGPLRKLMASFKAALIHDLTEDDFADMYAQTITYGLLSAQVSRHSPDDNVGALVADNLVDMVPVTNPFLRDLLSDFLAVGGRKGKLEFDELGVSEVVEALRLADMNAILRDFNDRNPQEDPVIHFYELFLKEYDAKKRMQRGVFYTPRPVVSYIVRSVHELLQTEFGLADGLADITTWREMLKKHPEMKLPLLREKNPNAKDQSEEFIDPSTPFVQILDPATGTATFLVEVIDVIHKTMLAKWKKQGHTELFDIPKLWNDYVPKHLLPRLHGYELMMAPYAIAHMKIGLKLFETGYKFDSNERVRVYLTNALEPAQDFSDYLEQMAPAMAHEAQAVNDVKRYQRFTVVIGNPPYAGHSKNNQISWIVDLVRDFVRDEPRLQGPGQGKWLQDDYVKFLRFSQSVLSHVSPAVLAMITNHRYLTNRTFKGMRRLWMSHFSSINIIDLHGNNVVNEISPTGHDENVFDIEQGVAIGIFVKGVETRGVHYGELWGPRTSPDALGKYDRLIKTSIMTTDQGLLRPCQPEWLFSPRADISDDLRSEFDAGFQMHEFMPGALGPNGKPPSGLATMHDNFAIGFSPENLKDNVRALLHTSNRNEAVVMFGNLCNPQQWDYAAATRKLGSTNWEKAITRLWVAPFDSRFTVYDTAVAVHLRRRLSDHFIGHRNLGFVVGEAGQEVGGGEWDSVSCVDSVLQLNYFRRNGSPTLPLYLYDWDSLHETAGGGRANLSAAHVHQLAQCLDLKLTKDGLPDGVTPEDFFRYAFAVLHSPTYRKRYAEFLKVEFPRLPWPSGLQPFLELSRCGEELVRLHLMESLLLKELVTTYIGPIEPQVEKLSYAKGTVWLDKKQTCGFVGVPEAVWNFHIGGYQVCQKWLKDRKGRTLSKDDLTHYQKIVVALNETIRLMKEIDEVIEKHGGWPGAFAVPATDKKSEAQTS